MTLHRHPTELDKGLRVTNLGWYREHARDKALPVHGADAVGLGLHTNGNLGADILWVPPNASFPIHAHPGDHLLLCLEGEGTISIDRVTYQVRPGDLYMVPGEIPHAVGAGPAGHVLVAIGSPHKPVNSPERMWAVDWEGNKVATPLFAE